MIIPWGQKGPKGTSFDSDSDAKPIERIYILISRIRWQKIASLTFKFALTIILYGIHEDRRSLDWI
jgi:hypothetical protein